MKIVPGSIKSILSRTQHGPRVSVSRGEVCSSCGNNLIERDGDLVCCKCGSVAVSPMLV